MKSHEAKHRGHDYTIELILYNKAIQQESDGALWRFEIRFMYEDRFKGIADKSSPVEALQILSNNIWDLRQYYYEAISKLTECMIRDFKEYRSAYPAEANCYQYLLINRDRLFLASQVKDFLEGIGHGSPKRGKKWFFEKYGDAFNLAKSKTELTHRG